MLPKLINVEKTCNHCDETFTFQADQVGLELWQSGAELIQWALPKLGAGWRELLVSGTCSDCFDEIMAEEEDDELEYDQDDTFFGDETDYYWDGDY